MLWLVQGTIQRLCGGLGYRDPGGRGRGRRLGDGGRGGSRAEQCGSTRGLCLWLGVSDVCEGTGESNDKRGKAKRCTYNRFVHLGTCPPL